MSIKLQKANREDMHELWEAQVEAFKGLLEKYQDCDMATMQAFGTFRVMIMSIFQKKKVLNNWE